MDYWWDDYEPADSGDEGGRGGSVSEEGVRRFDGRRAQQPPRL